VEVREQACAELGLQRLAALGEALPEAAEQAPAVAGVIAARADGELTARRGLAEIEGVAPARRHRGAGYELRSGGPGLGLVLVREAAGDDLRHAALSHADAVEHVGRVHGPLLVRDDHELGAIRKAPHELKEAVDVGVVQRRLDLVEDVEGRGPGEEDCEHECERDQGLLAPGEEREAARGLPRGGDLDLNAFIRSRLRGGGVARTLLRPADAILLAAQHQARAALLDQAEAATPPREEVLDQLLEVSLGGLERLLERGADAAVRVGDQALELRERRLEVPPLLLELANVLEGLGILTLGERVDRAQRPAAPR